MKYFISIAIFMFISSFAGVRAQNDPTLAGMILMYTNKAEKELNWKRKVDFRGLVAMMMNADMQEIVGMSCEEFRNRNR